MPYTIDTKHQLAGGGSLITESHLAVATLKIAREVALVGFLDAQPADWRPSEPSDEMIEQAVTVDGGTITLPNGDLIEVRRVGLNELRLGQGTFEMSRDELIAAYNAKHGVGAGVTVPITPPADEE